MKYVASLLVGLLTGALIFCLLLYFNPFTGKPEISPLAVSTQGVVSLRYDAVPGDSLLYTDNGENSAKPNPPRVADLWEPTIRRTRVMVVRLDDSRGRPIGIGIKYSSDSEATRILDASAAVESVWHIYLPGRGTLFVDQRENYWDYIRNVVIPARASSGDNWRGTWMDVLTTGPNALGTGRVIGGHGEFAGIRAEAVESLRATAYSSMTGPAAMEGTLTIAMPTDGIPQAHRER